MSVPIAILPSPAPPHTPVYPFVEQIADELAMALLDHRNIETLIYLGEGGGLALRRKQAERKVDALTRQLAQERCR